MALGGFSADFVKYNVIMTWITDCKHYTMKGSVLNEKDFIHQMQSHNYIHIPCSDEKNTIDIVLASSFSGIESSTDSFRKVLKHIGVKEIHAQKDSDSDSDDDKSEKHKNKAAAPKEKSNRIVIIVTKYEFSTNVQKSRSKFTGALIINHRHMDFACDKRKGPMCYIHRVMTDEEVANLTSFHKNKPSDYPILCINDPQAIWLNGKPGDLIEITRIEDNAAGLPVSYRYLSTKKYDMSGKSKTSKLTLSEE